MQDLLIALISAIIGIAVTFWVARYYFLRTVDKKLTPYIQIASPLLADVDESVRSDLKIFYRDVEVSDLYELQFIVINEGERPVRDIISPLTLELPKDAELLDVKLLYVYPEGRAIEPEWKPKIQSTVKFLFPLLNKGDFFVAKLLLRGLLNPGDLKFRITVDDLPPVLQTEQVPFRKPSSASKPEYGIIWKYVGLAIFILLFAVSSFYGLYSLLTVKADFVSSLKAIFQSPISAVAVCIWALGSLFFLILGVFGAISEITEAPKKPRFELPPHLRRRRFPFT